MKQKIVIKVQMRCEKCRIKTMEIVATTPGVTLVALEGDRTVTMEGENVDLVATVRTLRKKVGSTSVVSVEKVHEETEEEVKKHNAAEILSNNVATMEIYSPYPYNYYYIQPYHNSPHFY